MAKGRVLVTGGAGFIGSALVKALLAAQYPVRVLDDGSRGSMRRLEGLSGDLELVVGDVSNPDVVVGAAESVKTIFHLASVNGTELFYAQPGRVLEIGIRGMLSVIEACRTHTIEDLFVASSSEVYQSPSRVPTDETVPLMIPDLFNPRFSYAGQKIATELLTIHLARPLVKRAVIFRPHNVYGPDMGFEHVIPQLSMRAARLASSRDASDTVDFLVRRPLTATRAFIHIDDFILAMMLLIDRAESGLYHVGNPEEITIEYLAQLITSRFPCNFRFVEEPEVVGGTLRRCPDIRKLRALGFSPRIPLAVGIGEVVKWYAKQREQS